MKRRDWSYLRYCSDAVIWLRSRALAYRSKAASQDECDPDISEAMRCESEATIRARYAFQYVQRAQ